MATPTYWDYLGIDKLLALQEGLGDNPGPDELHFIIVHQTYELWFKLVLSQLRVARDHLAAPRLSEDRVPFVVHHLGRVNEILRLCVQQFQVMETLPPQDFLDFRDKLIPSSGFQSFQMREVEILLGLTDDHRVKYGGVDPLDHIKALATTPAGELAWRRIEQARSEVSLRTALHAWLWRTPIQGSSPHDPDDAAAVDRFLDAYFEAVRRHQEDSVDQLVRALGEADRPRILAKVEASLAGTRTFLFPDDPQVRRVRAALLFIESYRELPLLAFPRLLLDAATELEEQMLLFRNRHARMVERTIGRRVGSGGSSGVEYLDQTTTYRVFPELWAVRSTLLPRERLPGLLQPDRYGFAG